MWAPTSRRGSVTEDDVVNVIECLDSQCDSVRLETF